MLCSSVSCKIIDFGCSVQVDATHAGDTIRRLSQLVHCPGTEGYHLDDTLFRGHFKNGETDGDRIAFLRYMDCYSLSAVFRDCHKQLESIAEGLIASSADNDEINPIRKVDSFMIELMSQGNFESRLQTSYGPSLAAVAYAVALDIETLSPSDSAKTIVAYTRSLLATLKNQNAVLTRVNAAKGTDFYTIPSVDIVIEICTAQDTLQAYAAEEST